METITETICISSGHPTTKFSPQRFPFQGLGDIGQGMRDKDRKQMMRVNGKRTENNQVGIFVCVGVLCRGQSDCLQIERRQTWHIGKTVDYKVKKRNPVLG